MYIDIGLCLCHSFCLCLCLCLCLFLCPCICLYFCLCLYPSCFCLYQSLCDRTKETAQVKELCLSPDKHHTPLCPKSTTHHCEAKTHSTQLPYSAHSGGGALAPTPLRRRVSTAESRRAYGYLCWAIKFDCLLAVTHSLRKAPTRLQIDFFS